MAQRTELQGATRSRSSASMMSAIVHSFAARSSASAL
jgi:hypothetical protein